MSARCERAATDRTPGGRERPGAAPVERRNPEQQVRPLQERRREASRHGTDGRDAARRGHRTDAAEAGQPGESTPSPTGRDRRKPRALPGAWSRFKRKDARVAEQDPQLGTRAPVGTAPSSSPRCAPPRSTSARRRLEQAENELRSRLEREGWSNGYDDDDDDDDDRLTPGKRIRSFTARRRSEKEEDTSDKDELEEVLRTAAMRRRRPGPDTPQDRGQPPAAVSFVA